MDFDTISLGSDTDWRAGGMNTIASHYISIAYYNFLSDAMSMDLYNLNMKNLLLSIFAYPPNISIWHIDKIDWSLRVVKEDGKKIESYRWMHEWRVTPASARDT